MTGKRPELRIVGGWGSAPAGRIALSIVHPRERIDIPVSEIVRIDAHEDSPWTADSGGSWPMRHPCVEVSFTQAIRDRICRLTQQIVDEPMEIIVGGECVSSPVVREPLCTQASFYISASDFAEALALAHQMRTGWTRAGPRAIP
jgi:preprotein translocase subunit SecD